MPGAFDSSTASRRASTRLQAASERSSGSRVTRGAISAPPKTASGPSAAQSMGSLSSGTMPSAFRRRRTARLAKRSYPRKVNGS